MGIFGDFKKIMNSNVDEEFENDDLSESINTAVSSRPAKNTATVGIAGGNPSFVLVKPERFDDSISIADYIINGKTVVLNLEATGKELSRRIIDILSGTAYAVGAQIKNVSVGTYLIIPGGSDFAGDSSAMVDTNSFSL